MNNKSNCIFRFGYLRSKKCSFQIIYVCISILSLSLFLSFDWQLNMYLQTWQYFIESRTFFSFCERMLAS